MKDSSIHRINAEFFPKISQFYISKTENYDKTCQHPQIL